jgi:hypothetical protein
VTIVSGLLPVPADYKNDRALFTGSFRNIVSRHEANQRLVSRLKK